jgi:LysM repeat protein
MNRSPVFRTLLLCLLLLTGLAVAAAQTGNLLANPGFENPFAPIEGGTSMIAQGWTSWSLDTDQNVEPEYYLASDTVNGMAPPRIHSGDDAQQYFSFFAPHIAGVYQQVAGVAPGNQLSFSIYAYIWVSSGEDTNVSDGTGALTFEVGIDPTGGTDPTSTSIVWSDPAANYDQYAQYAIAAVAAADTVTVFVRSTVTEVAMNNTVYLDDAELTVTGSAAPEATEAATDAVVPTEETISAVTEEATEVATEALTEVATETAVVEATEAATEAAIVEITAVPTEVIPVVTEEVVTEEPTPTEEVITAATEEPTVAVVTEEPVLVTVEVVEPTEAVATEVVTAEATEEPTVEATPEVPTEVPPTETPTDVPTEVLPTVAPPTEVPTEVLATEIPTDAPPTVTPLPSPTLNTTTFPFMLTYTVVNGDTVGALATRFGSTIEAIIIANQLGADARIIVTQQLLIPVPTMPVPTLPPTETLLPSVTPIASATPFPTFTPFPSSTPFPTFTPLPSSTPLPAPTSVPTEVAVQVLPAQVNPTATTQIATTYVVQYGDSLSAIAVRFGVLTRDLARVNNIVNPNLVYVGQVLQIPVSGTLTPVPPTPVPSLVPSSTPIIVMSPPTLPPPVNPRVYQVMPGDNLYRISIRFNVPIRALIELNGIADASRIFVGQLLILP